MLSGFCDGDWTRLKIQKIKGADSLSLLLQYANENNDSKISVDKRKVHTHHVVLYGTAVESTSRGTFCTVLDYTYTVPTVLLVRIAMEKIAKTPKLHLAPGTCSYKHKQL